MSCFLFLLSIYPNERAEWLLPSTAPSSQPSFLQNISQAETMRWAIWLFQKREKQRDVFFPVQMTLQNYRLQNFGTKRSILCINLKTPCELACLLLCWTSLISFPSAKFWREGMRVLSVSILKSTLKRCMSSSLWFSVPAISLKMQIISAIFRFLPLKGSHTSYQLLRADLNSSLKLIQTEGVLSHMSIL